MTQLTDSKRCESVAGRPLTLLVLAAGLGRRYGGLKQVEPLGPGGEKLLDYAMFDAARSGFSRVVFVVRGEVRERLSGHLAQGAANLIEVDYVCQDNNDLPDSFSCPEERTKPWGTAHAVWSARRSIRGPFAVINADDFYGLAGYRDLAGFLRGLATDECRYALVLYLLERTLSGDGTVSRGICRISRQGDLNGITEVSGLRREPTSGKICGVLPGGETASFAPETPVSMNLWGFSPCVFRQIEHYLAGFLREHGRDHQAECYLPAAVNTLIAGGEASVRVFNSPDAWMGVTHPGDRDRVAFALRQLVAQGKYPPSLWS